MSNRSGSPYSTPRDANRVPFLVAASTADGITPVVLEADPTTHLLQVSSSGGGGGGTQYTDGSSTIAHPIGTIPVYDKAGTITAVSVANPLPVSATISTAGLATSTIQTDGTQKTQITDGTNTANVLKSDGTAAGQNAQLVAPAYKEVASLTAGSLNADLVPSTDVSGYSTFVLQVLGTWVGTLTLQGSNDNTNFVSIYGTWINNAQPVSVMSTNGIVTGSCNFRYLRVRMTSYTSGTATGTLELKTVPFVPTNITGQVNSTSTPVNVRATGNITTASSSITSASATGYSWAYVTISGTYAGISFGITTSDNGGTNYYNVPVWDIQNQKYIAPGATISPTDNSSSSYYVPQSATSSTVKVLATAYTSGTGAVAITGMSNTPFLPPSGTTGTTSAVVNVGQQTSNTSAVQLSSTSTVPTNGLIIQALSTNTASVFIGGSGVTTATGFELTSGSSLTIISNLNTIYVIGSNATDKVCWSVT